jgi:hypothetical protein
MGHRTLGRRAGVAVLVTAWAAVAAAQDLVIEGCDERLAGEIGVGELVGNVGQTVNVPVSIHSTTDVDAFLLSVDVPVGVVSYVRTDPGNLTGNFDFIDGNFFSTTSRVRVIGVEVENAIPAGTTGVLAYLVFEIVAPGAWAFGTSGFGDDIAGYVSCEDVHGTSAVEPTRWGRVKSLYR